MLLALVPNPLRWSVGYADTDSGKAGFELAFRPGSPAHSLPLGIGQHVSGRSRKNIRDMPPSRAAPLGNGPEQLHADRVYPEVTTASGGPGQLASPQPWPKG